MEQKFTSYRDRKARKLFLKERMEGRKEGRREGLSVSTSSKASIPPSAPAPCWRRRVRRRSREGASREAALRASRCKAAPDPRTEMGMPRREGGEGEGREGGR